MFDQKSRLPLYIQLRQWMINQIERGVYKDREKIPTEHNLSQIAQYKSPNGRQALAELVQEGYLVRKREGTYVSVPSITGDASILKTFPEEIEDLGLMPKAKQISKK